MKLRTIIEIGTRTHVYEGSVNIIDGDVVHVNREAHCIVDEETWELSDNGSFSGEAVLVRRLRLKDCAPPT